MFTIYCKKYFKAMLLEMMCLFIEFLD